MSLRAGCLAARRHTLMIRKSGWAVVYDDSLERNRHHDSPAHLTPHAAATRLVCNDVIKTATCPGCPHARAAHKVFPGAEAKESEDKRCYASAYLHAPTYVPRLANCLRDLHVDGTNLDVLTRLKKSDRRTSVFQELLIFSPCINPPKCWLLIYTRRVRVRRWQSLSSPVCTLA